MLIECVLFGGFLAVCVVCWGNIVKVGASTLTCLFSFIYFIIHFDLISFCRCAVFSYQCYPGNRYNGNGGCE